MLKKKNNSLKIGDMVRRNKPAVLLLTSTWKRSERTEEPKNMLQLLVVKTWNGFPSGRQVEYLNVPQKGQSLLLKGGFFYSVSLIISSSRVTCNALLFEIHWKERMWFLNFCLTETYKTTALVNAYQYWRLKQQASFWQGFSAVISSQTRAPFLKHACGSLRYKNDCCFITPKLTYSRMLQAFSVPTMFQWRSIPLLGRSSWHLSCRNSTSWIITFLLIWSPKPPT